MTNHIGQCGLCLETRELRNSHLLPAGIWKLSRESSRNVDPNPVIVTKTAALTTSRQVSAYFLCGECEDRVSKNGESYVLSECARPNGQFGLRKKLENCSPIVKQRDYRLFDVGSLLGKNIEKYLYFAGSVFWRASAPAPLSQQLPDPQSSTTERISIKRNCVCISLVNPLFLQTPACLFMCRVNKELTSRQCFRLHSA